MIEQSLWASQGSNFISNQLRTIKRNLSFITLFEPHESDIRLFSRSFATGDAYQTVKKIISTATLEAPSEDNLTDDRVAKPYIEISLTHSTDKSLRFR